MTTKTSPIGIIDSGIGGFSVALKMQQQLPHENLVYFGDGGNVPYGNHTAEEILAMTRYMLRFMEERRVKVLLVACNTISCLIDQYRDDMACPVLSIVEAGAGAVAQLPVQRVGVISTCFTHAAQCYPRLIEKTDPSKKVVSRGCPNLARLVETYLGDPAGQAMLDADVKESLDPLVQQEKIECCVLGCTHYPLIADNIQRLYPGLPLIDPADQMAKTFAVYLQRHDLANRQTERGTLEIYTTGNVTEYQEQAVRVGLDPVTSVQSYPIFKL